MMTVRELIYELSVFPGDLEVWTQMNSVPRWPIETITREPRWAMCGPGCTGEKEDDTWIGKEPSPDEIRGTTVEKLPDVVTLF